MTSHVRVAAVGLGSRRFACVLVVLAILVTALLVAAPAPPAYALYGPGADPASVDYARLEQGDDSTTDADITPDGRFVVFQTQATNFFLDNDPDPPGVLRHGGVFRFDRVTRDLQLVADGDETSSADGSLVLQGAANPSVSADGRFVAFSTAQRLVPQDTNDNVDVYVRDLAVPLAGDRAGSGAYALVSAKDGSDAAAAYAPHDPVLPGRNPGAELWPNAAISADGSRVVFRTTADSDLPDRAGVTTGANQVFVRDVPARRTTLVTRSAADGSPAGGAAGPAVLSGDGSTVVWVGQNAPAQTRFLAGERQDDNFNFYLWRRLDGTVTRRITGQSDPDDPACSGAPIEPDPSAVGPCYGPLSDFEEDFSSLSSVAPAVSPDGYRIAFLTSAGRRPAAINNPGLDLFLTDMSPGVSRAAGTQELTRDGVGSDARSSAGIQSVAMSADGQHLAIVTSRTNFLLPTLAELGTLRTLPDTPEIYVIDLAAGTIDRVVRSAAGTDANGTAGPAPTLSADGGLVAFTSLAGNLFFGDANGREDAFVAARQAPASDAGTPPAGANAPTTKFDLTTPDGVDLSMRLTRRTDGGLDVSVLAPGAGTVALAASASVASVSRAAPAAAKKSTKAVVAKTSKKVTKKGRVTLVLRLSSTYGALLKKATRVVATVSATFTATGSTAQTARDTATSSFVKAKKKTSKSKKKTSQKKTTSKTKKQKR